MADITNSTTSLTLLKRLKMQPNDEQAWREFVVRYGFKIRVWCQSWGLQESDAADVCQTVLLKLAKEMRQFERKPDSSFRSSLKTVSHHAWYDLVQSKSYQLVKGSEEAEKRLDSEAARDDLATHLQAAWDEELMELASQHVQLRVHPNTWRAFQLSAVESLSGEQVAEQLGMNLVPSRRPRSAPVACLERPTVALIQRDQ